MDLLGSFVIACSMYSKIPMPRIQWTEERMKYVMCFFPIVGVVMGILLCVFGWISGWLGIQEGSLIFAALGTALPILVTGGIHMDGYLDVTDARASYGEKEKKLEILKDPHVGAFAVIGCGVYLLLYLAVFSAMPSDGFPLVGAVYVLTRAMSGLAVVAFPKAKKSGLAASFSDGAQKQAVKAWMAVYIAACLGFMFWYGGSIIGICCCLASICVFWYYRWMAVKEFGGITGDLAGYFLQLAELVLLAVLAAALWLEGMPV